MKKLLVLIWGTVLLLLLPLLALSQVVPAPTPYPGEPASVLDAVSAIGNIFMALKSGNFLLAGSLVTLLLVFAIRKYVFPKINIGDGALPIVSIILGMFVGSAGAIIGGATAPQALLAVLSGPLASSLWSSLLKYFFKKP